MKIQHINQENFITLKCIIMVVPNIRNLNRHRPLKVARPAKSQYHLEPDHTFSYGHVGRPTKGGTGGGFVTTSSGAYGSNGDGSTTGSFGTVIAIVYGMFFVFCGVVWACFKWAQTRNENHGDIVRRNRNSVYGQLRRSERGNNNNAVRNDNITSADAIQYRTSPQVYNSPSGSDPIPYVTGPIPERNVLMKSHFYFQTVLPDKSNIDPYVLREEAEMGDTASDEDSVIETGDKPGKNGTKKGGSYQMSSRFLMSTWRRPTANDECSICLHSYNPGQTICLAKNPQCKHVFHHDCIEEWLKDHSDCPLCRVNLVYKPP
jgi:hypothetical protein